MKTGAKSALCRSRRELSNAYLLAKFGFDTAENEPCKVCPIDAAARDHLRPDARVSEVLARSREDDPDEQLERALRESQAFAQAMGVIDEDEVSENTI